MLVDKQLRSLSAKLTRKTGTIFNIFKPPGMNYYECRFMYGIKMERIQITDAMLGPAREVDFYNLLRDNYSELFL